MPSDDRRSTHTGRIEDLGGPLSSPAAQRNREPILRVLERELPPQGLVLEIASGTGEHAAFFAPRLAPRLWQPTDRDPELIASIGAWRTHRPCRELLAPLALDVTDRSWAVETADLPAPISAIVAINMIHIAPFAACEGMVDGAARVLAPGGKLYVYGPFRERGRPTAPSNEQFDRSLRLMDADYGLREVEAVAELAARRGLALRGRIEMPANNLSLVFEKEPAQ